MRTKLTSGYRFGCSDDCITRVTATGAAAAAANFTWYYVSIIPGQATVSFNYQNVIVLLVLGVVLAGPLDRLVK